MSLRFLYPIRKACPFLMCLLIVMLSYMPGSRFFCMPIVFVPIFYFGLYRSRLLNAYMAFILGLFADCVSQTPFGLFSFIYVLMFFMARLNRPFLRELSAKGLWVYFGISAAVLLLVQLFLFTVCEGSVIHTKFLFEQFTVAVLSYPLLMRVCDSMTNWIEE